MFTENKTYITFHKTLLNRIQYPKSEVVTM